MSYAPNTVVVVQETAPQLMDRSDYAGSFTMYRSQADVTLCGKQRLEHNGEDLLICEMIKGNRACCFCGEHPDLVVRKMDVGEISDVPSQEKTWVLCYCCCDQTACMGPNHDLFIDESQCFCINNKSECNIGEAEACMKCNFTSATCDFQRPDVGVCYQETSRQDILCMCQRKVDYSCDCTCHTCCKGQNKYICCVRKFAFPPDEDVPCGLGCCNIMCCGGQQEPPQPEGNTTVVVV